MEKVYIVSALRSPVGAFGGTLSSMSAGQLAANVIEASLKAANVKPENVDEVILGNVVSAGQGMGVARQAAIYAGIPNEIPAYGINMICGSGMKSLMDGASHIRSGEANVVVTGGVEVMSQIPFALSSSVRSGHKMGNTEMIDLMINDGLTDVFNQYHMGVTAENVAKSLSISRDAQDQLALESQQKAVAAIEAGRFKDEIVPIEIKSRKGSIIFDTDEYPKADATLEKLGKLRPAFDREGSVTAGNASGINDGASITILASESAVKELGLTPVAELVASAQSGLDPSIMGLGPVEAVTKVLDKADCKLSDIELFELNEAFAAQALGVQLELCKKHNESQQALNQRTNVNGGAIALGHPLGASGNRIIVTLIHEMRKRKVEQGVASLCVGGGMGTAVLIKTINS